VFTPCADACRNAAFSLCLLFVKTPKKSSTGRLSKWIRDPTLFCCRGRGVTSLHSSEKSYEVQKRTKRRFTSRLRPTVNVRFLDCRSFPRINGVPRHREQNPNAQKAALVNAPGTGEMTKHQKVQFHDTPMRLKTY